MNSRLLHGKQMGYHYTMGAKLHHNQIVKDQGCTRHLKSIESELNRRPLVTTERAPTRSVGRLPLDDQCLLYFSGTGENRTHIVRFKRPMHYLVCHNPKLFFVVSFQSAWRELNPRPSPYKDAALTPELHADA